MTEPLTPSDSDLRDFAFMPLDIVRLFGSEFNAQATDAEWRAGVTLWLKAWHQVPAGSLPDDDITLCRLAELGRDSRTWKKIKAGALRGWTKASDGRLYHSTVAEKANEAWQAKLRQRHRTFIAAIRKHNERHPDDKREPPSFEQWCEDGRPDRVATLPKGHADVARDKPQLSHATELNVARDIGSKGQGQGQGQGHYKPKPTLSESIPKPEPSHAREDAPPGIDTAPLAFEYVCRTADWHPRTDEQRVEALSVVDGWLASGFDLNLDILAGIRQARSRKPERTRSLKRFTSTIRGKHADRQGARLNGTGDLHRAQQTKEIVANVAEGLRHG